MKVLIALMLSLISAPLLAGFEPDANELKSLPQYCTPRIVQSDPAGWAAGQAQFGEGWNHMHHYCYALNFVNRFYRARDAESKKDSLSQAISNLGYMLSHTSDSYFMRGQFMLDQGRAMILQGKKPQGLNVIQNALTLDPELEPGYRYIADYYKDMGKNGEALKWVSTGLKYAPQSRALQRRYKELGGKEPFPEPITKPEAVVAKVPQEPSAANDAANPVTPPAAGAETPPPTVPKIGSSKNPYCRFCPD